MNKYVKVVERLHSNASSHYPFDFPKEVWRIKRSKTQGQSQYNSHRQSLVVTFLQGL